MTDQIKTGYPCTKCGVDTFVTDSRATTFLENRTVRRRRVCKNARCKLHFTTYEVTTDAASKVLALEELVSRILKFRIVAKK